MPHMHDAVAYPGFAYPDTHPDRMAVMATLHGLQPTPVAHCRVLEIGCNEGANLIPMAYAIPDSEFVGFDIAELPVARAQEKIHALSLSNVRVFQADITDIDQSLGKFDYIIAHGIYAWIAEPVRDSLLSLCRNHLTPNGIAFISYNALPGGHLRNLMREILADRTACALDPLQSVSAGVTFLKNIVELRPEGDPLSALLDKEAKRLEMRNPRDIYHDELSPDQRPVLFSTFAAHAARNDLRYVSESVVMTLNDPSNQPRAAALAKEMAGGDRIAEEQILDFVRMRGYRETLLCHSMANSSAAICLEAKPKAGHLPCRMG
jgi:SAM-dependent methyltransferase